MQIEAPMDSTSLTRWRKRIGEEGVETLLMVSIAAARQIGMIKAASVDRVIVDTTVMPKAIAHPTDSRLLEKSREHLVRAAKEHRLPLRQNYNREAPRLAAQIGRYAHAKQYRRMRKSLRTLRTRVGRVHSDVERQRDAIAPDKQAGGRDLLQRTNRILTQQTKDKNKLYALHAPEAECISKGKARTPYEFGVKVSVATTLREGLVVGMRSMPGNPYDGHTLAETLEQVGILAERQPHTAIVDRGYKGVPRRWRANPALGHAPRVQPDDAGDDQTAKCDRTEHRAYEDRRTFEPKPAQGLAGRRAACRVVRRRS